MEVATVPVSSNQQRLAEEKVAKRCYRNNTGGYLGVVQLDHRGEEVGVNVEPYGTIWLSDAEAILTARAPRRPEDNPFEEQTFLMQNVETGARQESRMRPLVLDEGGDADRPVERYVPQAGVRPSEPPPHRPTSVDAMAPARPGSAPSEPPVTPPVAAQGGPVPLARTEPAPAPPVAPPSEGLVGAGRGDEPPEARASWVAEPEAPGVVLHGSLGGSDDAAPQEAAAAAPDPTAAPAQRFTPIAGQSPVTSPVEEYAEAVDRRIGEETGAARPPAQPPAQGEYAASEEVGSPSAPAADEGEPLIGG